MNNKTTLIIPGLGDKTILYKVVQAVLKITGHTAIIYSFGWNDSKAIYDVKINKLILFVDDLQCGNLQILGVSAGGTVAINLLAVRPKKISKVIALASPLADQIQKKNTLLSGAIIILQSNLKIMPASLKKRILSVYGTFDEVVPIRLSKIAGVHEQQLPTIGHGLTIFAGLMKHMIVLKRDKVQIY